jgi:hypothetical protein
MKYGKFIFLRLLVLIVLMLAVTACPTPTSQPSTDSPGTTPEPPVTTPEPWKPNEPGRGENIPNDTQLNLLSSLGLFPSVKQRADPLGNPLPENYQPLKNPDALKVSQLFLTGETFGSSSWFRQDAKTSAAVFDLNLNKSSLTVTGATRKGAQDMASTIGNKPGKSIAADLNGNGIDEVIAAVANHATNEIDLYVLTFNADGTHKTAALQGSFQGVNIKAPPNYGKAFAT